MQQATIAKGKGYQLISYGNGLAYALEFEGESLFVQGDDAALFREEREGLERIFPAAPDYVIFRELMSLYGPN